MGNVSADPVGRLAEPAGSRMIFVIGSDPVEVEAEFTEQLSAASQEPIPFTLNDLSIGGAGAGSEFCLAATLVPFLGTEEPAFGTMYTSSSPDGLPAAFQEALARIVANAGVATWDFLGNTVVGSSDGKRFVGVILARHQAA